MIVRPISLEPRSYRSHRQNKVVILRTSDKDGRRISSLTDSQLLLGLLRRERRFEENLEARGGIEPPIKVLQTFALPLGDRALVLQDRPENTKPTGRLLWRWVETQSKLND
jgi:hypothetical protein